MNDDLIIRGTSKLVTAGERNTLYKILTATIRTTFHSGWQFSFSHHLCMHIDSGIDSLKLTPKDRFLRNVSWQFDLTIRAFARRLLRRGSLFSYFIWLKMSDLGFEDNTLSTTLRCHPITNRYCNTIRTIFQSGWQFSFSHHFCYIWVCLC